MAMRYVESELRRTGDQKDLKLANAIAARVRAKGDFPLISVAAPASNAAAVERIKAVREPLSIET
ncbi:MAG: hypothetical protein HYT83_00380 [Candidatus Levybacteria bacterium]|nr:hypothetical protein [Candidatus Levybacteria bacterium]